MHVCSYNYVKLMVYVIAKLLASGQSTSLCKSHYVTITVIN